MKKFKIFSLGLVLCFLISLTAALSGVSFAFAKTGNNTSYENKTYNLLDNEEIKASEYLYNFNGSPALRFRPNVKTLALISVGLK